MESTITTSSKHPQSPDHQAAGKKPKVKQRPLAKRIARLKEFSWRVTGCYVWLKIIAAFLGWYVEVNQLELYVLNQFTRSLSSIGFAPVNISNIPLVLKIGWVLVITAFRPLELIGLFFYVIFFPFIIPFILYIEFQNKEVAVSNEQGLRVTQKERLRTLPFITAAFAGWFLLYGGTEKVRLLIPGAVLAGLFFVLLTFRLFMRARPDREKLEPFRWAEWLDKHTLITTGLNSATAHKSEKDIQSENDRNQFARKIIARFLLKMRGDKAHNKISFVVLGEYISSLVMVATSAVLFWGLMIKTVTPETVPLVTCLHISLSHFLPGLDIPNVPYNLPLWASLGPAATAWVLFVLYIGPAGSLIPDKQKINARRLLESYFLMRNLLLKLGGRRRELKRMKLKVLEGETETQREELPSHPDSLESSASIENAKENNEDPNNVLNL